MKELLSKVRDATAANRTIRLAGLLKEQSPVIASEKLGEEIEITVFENGYVAYQNGSRATVFPLHNCCRDYEETDVLGKSRVIAFETFADQPWKIRVFMEGECRIAHNKETNRNKVLLSYNFSVDERYYLSDQNQNNPLTMMLKKEDQDVELARLRIALKTLTKKQEYVLFQCVVERRKQKDVARELGTGARNVSDMLKRAKRKLRKYYAKYGE